MLIIAGPTGVGKSDFAEKVASLLPAEIVNADMGQCYTPLSIGTAKPDWKESNIVHHGFDTINEPRDLTVMEYRAQLEKIVRTIWQQGKLPILVGGSSFYLASLFYPPKADVPAVGIKTDSQEDSSHLWHQLAAIDQERAQQIDPHDTYRIKRALEIWRTTGTKPSLYAPTYQPIAPYHMLFLTRETIELNERINKRVNAMLQAGWIDEVRRLKGTEWEPFLLRKKIIGYDDILKFLDLTDYGSDEHDMLAGLIAQRTRQYAKRQRTFWRMLQGRLVNHAYPALTINMTEINSEEYAHQLAQELQSMLF